MSRRIWSILSFIAVVNLAGCGGRSPEPPQTADMGVGTTASDSEAGVELSVETGASSITTTDRLRVRITVRRPIGEPLTLVEPDWAGAGWTLVDTIDSNPSAGGEGRIERVRTVVLEPFLDGVYEIPPVTVSWSRAGTAGTLASQPLEVRVDSVLAAGDDGVISPPAPVLTPEAQEEGGLPAGVVAACVLIGAGLVGYLLARPRSGGNEPDVAPIDRLRAIAGSSAERAGDIDDVHRTLATVHGVHGIVSLRPLLSECERARFGPEGGERRDPRRIAADAVRILEERR